MLCSIFGNIKIVSLPKFELIWTMGSVTRMLLISPNFSLALWPRTNRSGEKPHFLVNGWPTGLFFVRFDGNSILSKMLKLDFFPLKLEFFSGNWIFREFCANLIAEKSFLSNYFDRVICFMPFFMQKLS